MRKIRQQGLLRTMRLGLALWFVIAPIARTKFSNARGLSLAAFAAVCSSTSPPGGNQVDGLPPVLSF